MKKMKRSIMGKISSAVALASFMCSSTSVMAIPLNDNFINTDEYSVDSYYDIVTWNIIPNVNYPLRKDEALDLQEKVDLYIEDRTNLFYFG